MLETIGKSSCAQIQSFEGLRRLESSHSACCPVSLPARSRVRFTIQANKKVVKRQTVVLRKDVQGLGPAGTLTDVPNGFFRNYLKPQNLASLATSGILENIEKEKQRQEQAAKDVKAKAKAMAIALSTIGKFVIKKKVGEEDKIFGSVTTAEIVDAIFKQTGRELEKKDIELPEISKLGTYTASIRLHPEVVGTFNVVVQREKNA
ncbi:g8896 [Coccomyxa elongata]